MKQVSRKIIISADSTCDIGNELKERFHVQFFPYHILLGDRQYMDNVDITPPDLYEAWRRKRILPKTAAIGVGEYFNYFKPWVDNGYEVIHLNLGSALSSSYQNCCIAAQSLGHVYPIDSCSLSSGNGLLVIEAAQRIAAGLSAERIQKEVTELIPHVHASFILDTLEFMHAGGRCSSVVALGANLLHLKPCIEVDNRHNGAMSVGRKYRGKLGDVLEKYTGETVSMYSELKLDHVFITHSGIPEDYIKLVKKILRAQTDFREIHVTTASCTISSHCGPNTLGVLFMTKS
jgi:DegV family protein with EDD domain